MTALLQISWRMWQWKNFENWPAFDEVMCRLRRLTFFGPPCNFRDIGVGILWKDVITRDLNSPSFDYDSSNDRPCKIYLIYAVCTLHPVEGDRVTMFGGKIQLYVHVYFTMRCKTRYCVISQKKIIKKLHISQKATEMKAGDRVWSRSSPGQ